MQLRSLLNKIVIGVFLVLVLGVVLLQATAKKDLPASVTSNSATIQTTFTGPDVCGDHQCTGAETCSTCQQDCGLCAQTYCCNTSLHNCDGPFGVPADHNPCEVPGYGKFLYSYANGNEQARQKAYNSCVQTCGAQ